MRLLRPVFFLLLFSVLSVLPGLAEGSPAAVVSIVSPETITVRNGLIELEVARRDGIVRALRALDGLQYHDLGVTAQKASNAAPTEGESNDPNTALYSNGITHGSAGGNLTSRPIR
jgi:rhamnogalacturonan endolyase